MVELPRGGEQFRQIGAKRFDVLWAGVVQERVVTKKHRFARPTQDGLARLFDVSRLGCSVRIEPTSAALVPANSPEPAHNKAGFVLRGATPMRVVKIACLGADPNAIEILRLARNFIAAVMKVVIPLGVFDD